MSSVQPPQRLPLSVTAKPIATPQSVRLRSSDGLVFRASLRAVWMSNTIKKMIVHLALPISPVRHVHSRILDKVLTWCDYHQFEAKTNAFVRRCSITLCPWDMQWLRVNAASMEDLLHAAYYLDIPRLVEMCAKQLAKGSNAMSPATVHSVKRRGSDDLFDLFEEFPDMMK